MRLFWKVDRAFPKLEKNIKVRRLKFKEIIMNESEKLYKTLKEKFITLQDYSINY